MPDRLVQLTGCRRALQTLEITDPEQWRALDARLREGIGNPAEIDHLIDEGDPAVLAALFVPADGPLMWDAAIMGTGSSARGLTLFYDVGERDRALIGERRAWAALRAALGVGKRPLGR